MSNLKAQWKSKLNETHVANMPLILSSFLFVQILSAARDPVIAAEDLPFWMFAISAIFITISVGLVLWVSFGTIPTRLSHPVAALALLLSGLKPVAFMLATQDAEPLYMAVVLLAGSLCFLSTRYLVYSGTILIATWLAAATQVLPAATTVSALAIILLGAVLSVFALHRRIRAAMVLFALEQRVDTLEAILPMCASCKKTRDHTGKWQSVEEYIQDHQKGTQVSHGSCPSCTEELYGDLLRDRNPAAEAG